MRRADRRSAIREVAESIVAATAPGEIDLFPTLFEVYEHLTPAELLAIHRRHRDERLGIGVDLSTELMMSAAVYVALRTVDYVIQAVLGSLHSRGRSWRRWPRRPPRGGEAAAAKSGVTVQVPVDLPAEMVRVQVVEAVGQAGVTGDQARVMVDVVVHLVVASADGSGATPSPRGE